MLDYINNVKQPFVNSGFRINGDRTTEPKNSINTGQPLMYIDFRINEDGTTKLLEYIARATYVIKPEIIHAVMDTYRDAGAEPGRYYATLRDKWEIIDQPLTFYPFH